MGDEAEVGDGNGDEARDRVRDKKRAETTGEEKKPEIKSKAGDNGNEKEQESKTKEVEARDYTEPQPGTGDKNVIGNEIGTQNKDKVETLIEAVVESMNKAGSEIDDPEADPPGPSTDADDTINGSHSDGSELESTVTVPSFSTSLNSGSSGQNTPWSISEYSMTKQHSPTQIDKQTDSSSPEQWNTSQAEIESRSCSPTESAHQDITNFNLDQLTSVNIRGSNLKNAEELISEIKQYLEHAQRDQSLLSLVFPSVHDWTESFNTLLRLLPGRWLNDSIMNTVMTSISNDHYDIQVIDSHKLSRAFEKDGFERLACKLESRLILFPCHVIDHWFLAVREKEAQTLTFYDSKSVQNRDHGPLQQFLIRGFGDLKVIREDVSHFVLFYSGL